MTSRAGSIAAGSLGILVAAVVCVFAARNAFAPGLSGFDGTTQVRRVPGVALVNDRGALLRLDAPDHGEVLVLGYTRCTDQCPVTLAKVAVALGGLTSRPAAYFVTVDPTHDDARTLRHYLGAWNNAITGVTGTPQALNAIALALGAGDESRAARDHDTRLFVVDRNGTVREELLPDAAPAAIAQALRADT